MLKLALATFAILTAVSAAKADDDSISCTTEPQSKWMSTADISAKAVSAGYKDVRKVKISGSCYEVYAFTQKKEKAEIYMNPVTAEVVKAEVDG